MAHRKWKEAKQEPGTAGPGNRLGCCLISFHFLCYIHSIRPVLFHFVPRITLHSRLVKSDSFIKHSPKEVCPRLRDTRLTQPRTILVVPLGWRWPSSSCAPSTRPWRRSWGAWCGPPPETTAEEPSPPCRDVNYELRQYSNIWNILTSGQPKQIFFRNTESRNSLISKSEMVVSAERLHFGQNMVFRTKWDCFGQIGQ